MRTVPNIEPGSLCVVDRRASAVQVGRDVFVRAEGVLLLTRVEAIEGDAVTVRNPDPMAPYPDSRVFGPLPRSQVRGAVMVVFAPNADGARRGG
jgi:type IV secretory pathway protease TraF